MNYLLNAAVITSPGVYSYRLLSRAEAADWIRQNDWVSRIGYQATADHVRELSGVCPTLSRDASTMQVGDVALVVRLKYRVQDPGQKASWQPSGDDWEYGLLVKEGDANASC